MNDALSGNRDTDCFYFFPQLKDTNPTTLPTSKNKEISTSIHDLVVGTIRGEDEHSMREMLMLCYKWDSMFNSMKLLPLSRLRIQAASLVAADWTSRGATIWAPGVSMCTGR